MLYLRDLYQITSNDSLSFPQKIEQLLILGTQVLNLELAIISKIDEDTYTVKYAISPENDLVAGTTFPLRNTYCVHTLLADEATSFHHAGASEIAEHPCYLEFGLESYIGAPLILEGKRYGTINFSSSEARELKFSESDHGFIELLSLWVGNEIARNDKMVLLQQQKKRLLDQQNLLNEIGELAGVGAWEIDLTINSVHWSNMTRIIHEVSDEYIPELETAINFYKPGENRERIQGLVDKAMTEGGDFSGEFEIITHTGKIKWVAVKGRAELENGICVRIYGAFQDITPQVFYQQQLENRHKELSSALAARSTFLASMSHEFRTPINGVIGSLQVLDKAGLSDSQHHFLNLAQISANTLLAQINDVLDFSKIDSNQIELEITPFNINELLNDCVSAFTVFAKDKAITIDSNFSLTDTITINADPTRIRQIYANLISNAIKFTMQGQVSISSSVKYLSSKKALLILSVSDTGIGINHKQYKNLFLPFRQADTSTTRKFGGTGLGLSISQSLAKLMNGAISVQSKEGEGSTFTVEIEVSTINADKQSKVTEMPAAEKIILSQLRVLVVEDNEINQMIIGEMLRIKNIAHDIASDGVEALSILASQKEHNSRYSLILMDCQMPNMDGYETTENIRKLNSNDANIPIIALTANAMKGDREKCLESGMNDYLSKPLERETLYSKLAEYVK